MSHRTVAICGAVALLLVLLVRAFAHNAPSGWTYPLHCCSDRDCHQLADDDVEILPTGWFIKSDNDFVPREKGEPSPDGNYHVCRLPSGHRLCFFYKPVGS